MTGFLAALASNGPWALVAGFLLQQVIKAWTSDRRQLTELLGEFKTALEKLETAVTKLSDRIDYIEARH